MTERKARKWCNEHGFEFKSWDGIFCAYRDPRHVGSPLEFGLENWIDDKTERINTNQLLAKIDSLIARVKILLEVEQMKLRLLDKAIKKSNRQHLQSD